MVGEPERALTFRQPHAEMILDDFKTVEIRPWKTPFRGRFYIHAGKAIDETACEYYKYKPYALEQGALVGIATLADIIKYTTSEAFKADDERHRSGYEAFTKPVYGWVLTDVERLDDPIPYKGKLGLFHVR